MLGSGGTKMNNAQNFPESSSQIGGRGDKQMKE